MKSSNITYSSNVYVFTGVNKITDAAFMAHVLDPGAIRELAENNRRVNGTTGLRGIQQTIYGNAKPCALGNGDYTHGTVLEDGKLIYVNKCENATCKEYSKCSKHDYFRAIERTPEATFDFDKKVADPVDYIHFDIKLEVQDGLKVPKINKVKKIEKKTVVTEIEEITQRYNDALQWGVRPHIRHLADGTTTWVKGHIRGHGAQSTSSGVVRTIIKKVSQKFRCKNPEKIRAAFLRYKQRTAPIDIPQTYQLKNIQRIESAEKIISSDIESKILVNAGPGTGKTHTVIERLKYLAKNNIVDPEYVFVLCFSRSAVRVINDRLDVAIKAGEIPLKAKQFNIATFDSFATWFLKESELDYDLYKLNYDARIARFIDIFKKDPNELIDLIGYLIVDEVQDLVGIRAELVKALLKYLQCGFLLLGDECQAIYDYQITNPDELNATKLYEWIEYYFGHNICEYELTRNHRNEGRIGDSLKSLRTAMLSRPFGEQKSATEELFNKYDLPDMGVDEILKCCAGTNETQAILSWSNGDAYRQSSDLYSMGDKSFTHRILTGARRLSYRKEIADILSGYIGPIISQRKFFELANAKNIDSDTAQSLWDGFSKILDRENASEIKLEELRRLMVSERRVADSLLCPETATLTISTIHKAKGKEYDTVLVNRSGGVSKSDDVKVYYVAMTRAKKELIVKRNTKYLIDRPIDKRMETGRYVEVKNGIVKRIELGLDGDIDPIGFITGDNVTKRQEYIASCVKQGDPIKISKHDGKYYIVHEDQYIGEVRPEIFKDWRYKGPYQWRPHTFKICDFTDFEELFVSDIVTIVNTRLDPRMPDEYKKCGFWYGIEFCGYAKPKEE